MAKITKKDLTLFLLYNKIEKDPTKVLEFLKRDDITENILHHILMTTDYSAVAVAIAKHEKATPAILLIALKSFNLSDAAANKNANAQVLKSALLSYNRSIVLSALSNTNIALLDLDQECIKFFTTENYSDKLSILRTTPSSKLISLIFESSDDTFIHCLAANPNISKSDILKNYDLFSDVTRAQLVLNPAFDKDLIIKKALKDDNKFVLNFITRNPNVDSEILIKFLLSDNPNIDSEAKLSALHHDKSTIVHYALALKLPEPKLNNLAIQIISSKGLL